MAQQSLATKYRPSAFNDIVEQNAVKKILQNQLSNKSFQNAYLFCGPAGDGKALPMDADLLTPTGYIKMKDVKINDTLIDGKGHHTKVTDIFPQGKKPVYKITFNDNTSTLCSDEHLWKVTVNNEEKVLKTIELMDFETTHYSIPTPIVFLSNFIKQPPSLDFDISNGIPYEYKYSDIGIRFSLMNVVNNKYNAKYIKNNTYVYIDDKSISDDFAFIIRSLGGIDMVTYMEGNDNYEHCYRLPKDNPDRYITNIKFIKNMECQCIKVNSKDHTFITNDMIVTHNTTTARIFADELNNHQGNIIELDAASHNGIEDIRNIINQAKTQSITGEYKVFLLDECYTPDVEILTENGFVRFDKLKHNAKVAQWDNEEITFVQPTKHIIKNYKGEVYELNGIKMTPNHIVPYRQTTKNWFIKKHTIQESYISELKFDKTKSLILGGKCIDGKNEIGDFTKLCIICQYANKYSSNNYYNKYFYKKDEELIQICENLKIEYKITDSKITFNVPTAISVKDYLDYKYDYQGARQILEYNKKYNPELIFHDNMEYYKTLAVIAGYNPQVIDNKLILNEKFYQNCQGITTYTEQYSGKVYCVKVPSEKIIVRYNDFVMVNGNCHALSNNAWQALLKIIEEPPAKTIFLMCTTDPQKIPNTILSRMQRYDFKRISQDGIYNRLLYVLQQEEYGNIDEETKKSITYITKLADGGMRDALTYLDKCLSYGKLTLKNTVRILGSVNYDIMIELTDYILQNDKANVLQIIEKIYSVGRDLKNFAKQYTIFLLDVQKYNILNNFKYIQIPETEEYKTWLAKHNNIQYILDAMISLDITYSAYPKADIEICLLNLMRD